MLEPVVPIETSNRIAIWCLLMCVLGKCFRLNEIFLSNNTIGKLLLNLSKAFSHQPKPFQQNKLCVQAWKSGLRWAGEDKWKTHKRQKYLCSIYPRPEFWWVSQSVAFKKFCKDARLALQVHLKIVADTWKYPLSSTVKLTLFNMILCI